MEKGTIYEGLVRRGVSRRDFLKFCATTAAVLGLSSSYVPKIAEAMEKKEKPVVVWLHFQDCTGCSESVLRATKPTIGQIVLDVVSLEYHETIMAAAGHQAEKSLHDAIKKYKGKYLVVVEGAIPTKDGGLYCCIGGRAAVDILKEVAKDAAAIIAIGTCATYGGIPAAKPNPTGAVGVKDIIKDKPVINLPGCPLNVENFTATVVYFLTFGKLPKTDNIGRPLFAHGIVIHENCERRGHFDTGEFAKSWGDKGHRLGWCLYELGCKGPFAYHNCPTIRWNDGTSWPVMAGHPCVACSEPKFWDANAPFYADSGSKESFFAKASKIGLGAMAVAGLTKKENKE
ncbi:hydrogenase small subunit [Thermodesulfovibrio yellowstonii]|uniref:Ni/Fe hydrogenase n=1 Tax=Thermodesulfovibrio yellowstonii TaxID=28262 RepID=A0A9W6GCL6_9BACT|nr:hydrogenase small subunit [Thermodesulfovibrio islandicus]GLI52703.1 Ni/Fe hydrogenase [Thermodesulfovibrio islandicus]